MKRFWCGNKGSVSVYLIIVIVPIFLFHALFIDLLRIRLADRESELAVKAGLRSVMSEFKPALQAYGLYGLQWNTEKHPGMFDEVARENMSSSPVVSGFRYIDTTLEKDQTVVQPFYSLANRSVIQRQILNEMKVKAPVQFALEIADKFKSSGAAPVFTGAANFYEKASALEKLADKRDAKLDEAWERAQTLAEQTDSATAVQSVRMARLQELSRSIGLHTLEEIKQSISHIEQSIDESKKHLTDLEASLKRKKNSLTRHRMRAEPDMEAISELRRDISNIRDEIGNLEHNIRDLADRRELSQEILKDLIEFAALLQLSKVNSASQDEQLASTFQGLQESLDEAQQWDEKYGEEAEQLLKERGKEDSRLPDELFQNIKPYGTEYFSRYKIEAGKLPAMAHGIAVRWHEVGLWNTGRLDAVSIDIDSLEAQSRHFFEERSGEERKRNELNASIRKEKTANRSKVKSAINDVKKALNGSGSDPFDFIYKQLEGENGLHQKYARYNQTGDEPDTSQLFNDDQDQAAKNGMNLLKTLAEASGQFRDKLYIDEFALTKFSYRTLGKEKNTEGQVVQSFELSQPQTHPLQNQEAEYMLYGFSSCNSNYAAAYGEMFVLLFGIRTAEALLEPGTQAANVGSPMLSFLVAAAKGAVQAAADMHKLLEGESIALLQKVKAFTLNYKDLLRIFYLIHGKETSITARMQALIDYNTGTDLTQTFTYLQSKTASSLRLWFMPGIAKLVHASGGAGSQTKGNRYYISKTAVFSYD